MTKSKSVVKDICNEIYKFGTHQIIIDLVQDEIEEVLSDVEFPPRDSIGALVYEVGLILEIINPRFERDINFLTRLKQALKDWETEIENTNVILGLPKET